MARIGGQPRSTVARVLRRVVQHGVVEARGDGDTRSDIDLFLVRPMDVPADDPSWRQQLDRLATRIERWTGNRASLADVALDDVVRLARERPPVVGELEREAITLQGPPAHELLAGAIP